jgi:hypothetical protein
MCLTNIQNDMVRMEDNINELDLLREQLTRNVTHTDKLSNIISKLKVYDGANVRDITIKKFEQQGPNSKDFNCHSASAYIKIYYKLEILKLNNINFVDFQYMCNDYLTTLILEYGGNLIINSESGIRGLKLLNLNYLPSLKVIQFKHIAYFDIDGFIKELSSYEHKIETFVFTDCQFITNRFSYMVPFEQLKSYCDENNIKLEF